MSSACKRSIALALICASWAIGWGIGAAAQERSPSAAGKTRLQLLQESTQFATLQHPLRPAESDASETLLAFTMARQEHSKWCWAATASSISVFYNPKSSWSQCKIASMELHRDCCDAYSSRKCNKIGYLDDALLRTGNYNSAPSCASRLSRCRVLEFDAVVGEIDKERPLGIRVGWQDGGGHFLAIYGYRADAPGRYYYVYDPIHGRSPPLTEDDLKHRYRFTGSWTHSYYTKPEQGSEEAPSKLVKRKALSGSALQLQLPKAGPQPVGFKLAPVDQRYVALTERARPFLDSDRSEKKAAEGKQFSLAVAHDVYVAGLKQLASSASPLPRKASGTRVLEMADGKLFAAYDVTKGDGRPPALVGGSASKAFIDALSDALETALKLSERTKEIPELRLLTAPALYFEALWLHYKRPADDVFIPILSRDIPVNRPIGAKALIGALRAMARKGMEPERTKNRESAP